MENSVIIYLPSCRWKVGLQVPQSTKHFWNILLSNWSGSGVDQDILYKSYWFSVDECWWLLSGISSVFIQKMLNWFLRDLVEVLMLPRGWTVQTLIPSHGPSRSVYIKRFTRVPPQKNLLTKYVCIMMMLKYSSVILLYSAYSDAYVSRSF